MHRQIALAGQMVSYRLERRQRRTIGLSIDMHGLSVTAPSRASDQAIELVLRDKQRWIATKLLQLREQKAQLSLPSVWEDGACFPYLGSPLHIRLDPAHANELKPVSSTLELRLPRYAMGHTVEACVQAWVRKQACGIFTRRLDHYASKLHLTYTGLSLSSAKTRWGSCSNTGHIRLSWRLIYFSLSIIDYVVAHELAHLKEMNHGPKFWETVSLLLPEYSQARAALKKCVYAW
jgi:predicted metal-dependent hydrolase